MGTYYFRPEMVGREVQGSHYPVVAQGYLLSLQQPTYVLPTYCTNYF